MAGAEIETQRRILAESLSILRATLESSPDGLLVVDSTGLVTDSNENFAKLWRIPRELMDTRDRRRIVDAVSAQLRDPRRFLAREEQIDSEAPAETFDVLELADGRTFERSSRLLCLDGRSVGRVYSVRDITERVEAQHEHAYLSAIVANSTDAIVSKTLGGVITSWNQAAERIFGYPASEAIGRPMAIIIPEDRLEEERQILESLSRGETIDHLETVRVRKDGCRIHVALTISPVRDFAGRIIGVSKIARDITEREQLLSREQMARARAEEANRLKDEFLATVSHELRNPLNAILGWAQILRREPLDEKIEAGVEVIERNARAQARLIEDLLDVSRIVAGKMHIEVQRVMPVSAVQAAIESARVQAEAKGLEIDAALDPTAGPVAGDASRLQQIVWNLLSNAVKFTPKGGRIRVRLEREATAARIVVRDTGQGIAADFLPHVFDRFRQGDASTERRTGGLGLGLSIVRHLVELHGGTVTAESPGVDQGTTFTVSLPLRPTLAEEAIDAASFATHVATGGEEPNLGGVRVLVVDDEPDTRKLLRVVLDRCGAEVREAGSARQALDVLEVWQPTLIVSDIGMPGEDGYTLMRKVRALESGSGLGLPAVALTAYARNEDRRRAIEAGYQLHLAKPIEAAELVRVVARAAGLEGQR